jgi:Flp pilus assembly protein TadD
LITASSCARTVAPAVSVDSLVHEGDDALRAGDLIRAERSYQQAASIRRDNAWAWIGLAHVQELRFRDQRAAPFYRYAFDASPDDLAIGRLVAAYFENNGEPRIALKVVTHLEASNGSDASLFGWSGRLRYRLGDAEARRDLEVAWRRRAASREEAALLARLLEDAGESDYAQQVGGSPDAGE